MRTSPGDHEHIILTITLYRTGSEAFAVVCAALIAVSVRRRLYLLLYERRIGVHRVDHWESVIIWQLLLAVYKEQRESLVDTYGSVLLIVPL